MLHKLYNDLPQHPPLLQPNPNHSDTVLYCRSECVIFVSLPPWNETHVESTVRWLHTQAPLPIGTGRRRPSDRPNPAPRLRRRAQIDLELASWYESLVGTPSACLCRRQPLSASPLPLASTPGPASFGLFAGGRFVPDQNRYHYCREDTRPSREVEAARRTPSTRSCGLEPFSAACIYRSSPSLLRVVPITYVVGIT
ncbi:hypothetical protein BJX96DRAFT_144100 [Aspergillus floccosus]